MLSLRDSGNISYVKRVIIKPHSIRKYSSVLAHHKSVANRNHECRRLPETRSQIEARGHFDKLIPSISPESASAAGHWMDAMVKEMIRGLNTTRINCKVFNAFVSLHNQPCSKVPLSFALGWEYIAVSQCEASIVVLERSLFFCLTLFRTYGVPSTPDEGSCHQSEICSSLELESHRTLLSHLLPPLQSCL